MVVERIDGHSILEEDNQDESAREAAQVIEELQRAQADTLTDDEFDEQSNNPSSQIGGRERDAQQFSQYQRSPNRQNGFPAANRSINNRNQVPVPSSGGSGTSNNSMLNRGPIPSQ